MSNAQSARPKAPLHQIPSRSLRFLYRTVPGRILLWLLTRRWISRLAGLYMNSRLSVGLIKRFIRKNQISMRDYEQVRYGSFNDFFTRRVTPSARPMCRQPDALVSPCDARLSVYTMDDEAVFLIKNTPYRVADLIADEDAARRYNGGIILIFRLAVDDYHRYHYFDDCVQGPAYFIPGELHTVQPIAFERYRVFARNCREWCVLHTEHFGDVVQIEVGALMVGRIRNTGGVGAHARGEEKGRFEFGGSTIALLLPADAALLDAELWANTAEGFETIVKCGECIGRVLTV